jgi:Predicted membrane protein
MLLFGAVMPVISRRDISFGVKIHEPFKLSKKLSAVTKIYLKIYLLISIVFVGAHIYFMTFYTDMDFFPFEALAFILEYILTYLFARKRVLKLKDESKEDESGKSVIVIDTNFRSGSSRILPSHLWFLVPVALICVNIIAGFIVYEGLPLIIPTHWNRYGVADGGVFKNIGVIFMLPLIQLLYTILAYFLFLIIGKAKQSISTDNPEEWVKRERLFRYRWGSYIIIMITAICLLFDLNGLKILYIIDLPGQILILVNYLFNLAALISIIYMALWTGQSGSRIVLKRNETVENKNADRDDDKNWLIGLFYFNKNDPALFVENRFGIGWGFNFARIGSYVIIFSVICSFFLLDYIIRLIVFI